MNSKINGSEPDVPVLARAIVYNWDGSVLIGALCLLDAPDVISQMASSCAPEAVFTFDSWITADQAIHVLKKVIWAIKTDGIPSATLMVTRPAAQSLEMEGDDE